MPARCKPRSRRNGRLEFTVAAAGNSGSSCSTVVDPPATYADSFTVGALNTGSGYYRIL